MNVVSSKVALKLVATMQVEYYVETVQIVRGGYNPHLDTPLKIIIIFIKCTFN